MPDLAQLQSRMAQALLQGRFDALDEHALIGPVTAVEAVGLHRNTALHGLVNALRLSYPTVDALVGGDFFDQAALAFVAIHPPASPWLTGYGSDFPAFLASYAFAADLAYLPDVARLDAAIEAVASQSLALDGPMLDLGAALVIFDGSLRVIELDYPAAAIRDAIEGDENALGAIDMTPRRHALALWRAREGAALRPVGPLSAAFLKALLDGQDLQAVLAGPGDPASLQSEIFAAPFARIVQQESPKP